MKKALISILFFCSLAILFSCSKDENSPQVISGSGDIQTAIDEYRSLLGANNGNAAGSQTNGRREISWDGVPDSLSAPYFLPHDFFKAKGADFTTPGTGVQVSADQSNPSAALPSFGNINPNYQQIFPAFSAERLFSPIGSNVVDLRFYVPGTSTPAVVRGFGAVYVDVDRNENTAFEYFDINDHSLGVYATPAQNNGHVFLGVLFDSPIVHRVRIEYGNTALGPDDGGSVDVSVMDDFIFGEPQEN